MKNLSRWWQLKYFWNFHPEKLGQMSNFDGSHIFQMGGEKPPTRRIWVVIWILKKLDLVP